MSKFLKISILVFAVCFAVACEQAPQSDAGLSAETDANLQATAETHANDVPEPTPVASTAPKREVITSRIAYGESGDRNLHGYLSVPADATGSLPALIVIHEWWGLNDNIRDTAERLAAEGYITLAVDLYGEQVAETPKEAMKLMQNLTSNRDEGLANLEAAYRYLADAANAPKVGVIGWCLGGQWSLRTALLLPDDIDASVIYYGSLVTDKEQLKTLNMPILGLFAGNDPIVPRESVEAFRSGLTELGKPANIYVYEDAKHAFANPSGMSYDAEAAEDAWQKTLDFLAKNLEPESLIDQL